MLRKQRKNISADSRILDLPIAILSIDIFNECKVQNACLVRVQGKSMSRSIDTTIPILAYFVIYPQYTMCCYRTERTTINNMQNIAAEQLTFIQQLFSTCTDTVDGLDVLQLGTKPRKSKGLQSTSFLKIVLDR